MYTPNNSFWHIKHVCFVHLVLKLYIIKSYIFKKKSISYSKNVLFFMATLCLACLGFISIWPYGVLCVFRFLSFRSKVNSLTLIPSYFLK